jgi:Predicted AAA-ATPase/PD-(D/E)XK nuclease superfamily
MSTKKLPVGISDYKELIEENYYYVDKTLLIKEIIDRSGKVMLIPRPRRFGKTLNLSMLKYFFEQNSQPTEHLFYETSIWQDSYYRQFQGQYPVIFITFKDIKEDTWDEAYRHLTVTIANEFAHHEHELAPTLSAYHLRKYNALLERTADSVSFSQSLLFLTELLYNRYQKRVIILIDEYDGPIHTAYTYNYYDAAVKFMRSLLTGLLKDNSFLERGILTGILRMAKEGIFSGLNNLSVFTLLSDQFADKFGFTATEVDQLLIDQKLIQESKAIKTWYNGYRCGTVTLYNPWSLLQCIAHKGELRPYWLNTSDNQLIMRLIALSDNTVKSELEALLTDSEVIEEINEGLLYPGIEHNKKALWSLLLFAGYITYTHHELREGKDICSLKIPNTEIKLLYQDLIKVLFGQLFTSPKITLLMQALTTGNTQTFTQLLEEFVQNSMSVYDLPNNEPEKSYHLFVLGILVLLSDNYEVKSNRESGLGRYDIMIIPKQPHKLAIIIEFKKVLPIDKETLEITANRALEQIKEKNYAQELKARGITHIKAFGIAFAGKTILVKSQDMV